MADTVRKKKCTSTLVPRLVPKFEKHPLLVDSGRMKRPRFFSFYKIKYPFYEKENDCIKPENFSVHIVFSLYPRPMKLKGCILVSPCPSIRLSVCGQNRVHSASSTTLAGFISYLHILSSNFRRCVASKDFFFEI